MPGTGYDEAAMRIGSVRSGTRPRWFRVTLLSVFLVAVAVGALTMSLFK
jgi:hypothetical protein